MDAKKSSQYVYCVTLSSDLQVESESRYSLYLIYFSPVFAGNGVKTIVDPSLGSFVRAYMVYTICSVPASVDASHHAVTNTLSLVALCQPLPSFSCLVC